MVVSEGTSNLDYTTARFYSAFGGKSTSDLSEGSNLYYTDARVQAVSINNVVEDTTPQLGGDLDLNSSDITGTGNINITGTIQSSGNITGTLATAAQPNITSVGTLTGLTGGTGDLNWDSGTLFVDSSANRVGIGVTPSETLHVASRSRIQNLYLGEIASNFDVVQATSSAGLYLTGGGSNGIYLDSSANVGIGLASPSAVLETFGGTSFVGAKFKGYSGGKTALIGGDLDTVWFGDDDGSIGTTNNFNILGSSNVARIVTNSETRVTVDGSGAVGIGQIPETARYSGHDILQVGGRATLLGNDTVSATGQTVLLDNLYYDASGNFQHRGDSRGVAMQFVEGKVIFSNSNQTTGTPTVTTRMTLDNDGNLLVGSSKTTSTATAGLYVSGNDFMSSTNTSTATGDRLLLLNQQNMSLGDLVEVTYLLYQY